MWLSSLVLSLQLISPLFSLHFYMVSSLVLSSQLSLRFFFVKVINTFYLLVMLALKDIITHLILLSSNCSIFLIDSFLNIFKVSNKHISLACCINSQDIHSVFFSFSLNCCCESLLCFSTLNISYYYIFPLFLLF
jgi:hypothetical protein